MPRKVTQPNFERFGFNNEGDNRESVALSDDMLQALARLIGWNDNKEQWDFVTVDSDGRLLVSTSPTKAQTNVSSQPVPTTSAVNVVGENLDRKVVIIQNVGAVDCYLAFGETATTSNGLLLEAGATYIEDVWLGSISGICASGSTTLHVQEME